MYPDDAIPYSQDLDHVYASGEHPELFDQICAYWKFFKIYMAAILFLLDLTAWQLYPPYVAIKSSMI